MPASPNGRCRCSGSFDAAFLDVPPRSHPAHHADEPEIFRLPDARRASSRNHFVCVANIDASDGGAAIVAGNEKVLAARLSDAKFFWEQDLKMPLAEQAKKLDQIVFHEKLGTIADKVERVAKLARWLVERSGSVQGRRPRLRTTLRPPRASPRPISSPSMVGEFPELQGVIGGYFARAQGEDPTRSPTRSAIITSPWGRGTTSRPPGHGRGQHRGQAGYARRLLLDRREADRLADPFALRRAALGFLQLLTKNKSACRSSTSSCRRRC